MAKTGVLEGDPAAIVKATEFKKELQKLVKAIVEDDDISVDAIDNAQRLLISIKELKLKNRPGSLKLRYDEKDQEIAEGAVPAEFLCPISKKLMRDPVILATGQTYDRAFIQKWLKDGNRTCPLTQQVLSHTILTPNHLISEMISQWCKENGIKLPDTTEDDGLTKPDRDRFISLLKNMSSSLSDQKESAKELRLLTKRIPSFRALFGESLEAIPQLLSPLSKSKCETEVHPKLQEDIITTLLNLSIHDNNKKLVGETPMVIPLLIKALKSGTIETKTNAAAALFTLSALDSNKELIGKAGAFVPLVDLLDEGNPMAMKDVASAIFNLCILHDNKARAVRDGAVPVILKKLESKEHVDELLAILAMLSTNQRAIEAMELVDTISLLFRIIKETDCSRNKENCIAILHTICYSDRASWKELREEELAHKTISQLAQDGTSRAKRKASGILQRLNRSANLTHTA